MNGKNSLSENEATGYGTPQNSQYGLPQIPTTGLEPGVVGSKRTRPKFKVPRRNEHLAASLLSLFCCFPVGLMAVVMSMVAMFAFEDGRYEDGRMYGSYAGWLALIAFLLGLAIIAIVTGVVLGMEASHHSD